MLQDPFSRFRPSWHPFRRECEGEDLEISDCGGRWSIIVNVDPEGSFTSVSFALLAIGGFVITTGCCFSE